MTIIFEQTIEEQKKDFLFAYFNRPVLWLQRKFLGPFIIFLSLVVLLSSYMSASGLSWYLYGLFFLLFGISYIFRPRIFMRRMRFEEGETTEIEISEGVFTIKGRQVDIRLEAKDFLKSIRKKEYLFIKVRINRALYFCFNLNKIEEKEVFLEKIEFLIHPPESDPARKTEDLPEDSRNRDQSV